MSPISCITFALCAVQFICLQFLVRFSGIVSGYDVCTYFLGASCDFSYRLLGVNTDKTVQKLAADRIDIVQSLHGNSLLPSNVLPLIAIPTVLLWARLVCDTVDNKMMKTDTVLHFIYII